ncbi:MAG: hypothetical protein JRJ38_07515 [Deltaproteobacteria bacterium]|nr:hypothetical protein [Deltaproteobacteria bacterium]
MIVERGKKILIICAIVVFVSILVDFFITPKLVSLVGGYFLFGLLFFLTYRGYNWSRICLFFLLLLSGLGGSYGGVMILSEYQHPAGILIVIMSLLNLAIGFILVSNKSVKAFVNRARP